MLRSGQGPYRSTTGTPQGAPSPGETRFRTRRTGGWPCPPITADAVTASILARAAGRHHRAGMWMLRGACTPSRFEQRPQRKSAHPASRAPSEPVLSTRPSWPIDAEACRVTINTYAHVLPALRQEAADAINELFGA